MKLHKKSLTGFLAAALALTMAVGTLAFFTDRLDAKATAKAGTLKLAVTTPTVSKTTQLKPSDGVAIAYTLTNNGNKSADIKETLVLSSSVAMTTSAPEFELYDAADVTIDTNGIATVKTGKLPLATRTVSSDGKKITYDLSQFTLNGTGTDAEVETDVTSNSKARSLVLVFKADSANKFQNCTVTLDYLAQGKQHRNTGDDTWTTLKNDSITFGGAATSVVPKAS